MPTIVCENSTDHPNGEPHHWETRAELDEIDRLRCSKCGTTADEFLRVVETKEGEDQNAGGTAESILQRVERESKRMALLDRVNRTIAQLKEGSPAQVEDYPPEVRTGYRQLNLLRDDLENVEDELSKTELIDIGGFIDGITSKIEDHTDEIQDICDARHTLNDLERQIKDLRKRKKSLTRNVEELDGRYHRINRMVTNLRSEKEHLEMRIDGLKILEETYISSLTLMNEHPPFVSHLCPHCGSTLPAPLHEREDGSTVHHECLTCGWAGPEESALPVAHG